MAISKKAVEKGTRMVEYKSRHSTWKEAGHRDGANAYIYYVNRNFVFLRSVS